MESIDEKIKKLFKNDIKISHAYLLSVDDSYNTDVALEMIKQILNKNDDEIKKIEINDDIKIIRPNGKNIRKDQISDLIFEFNNKSVNDNCRFYIIEFAEDLNVSSANSLLKFLEEPEENIVAILVTKNINVILPTIVSRCQVINLNNYINNIDIGENKDKYNNYFIQIIKNRCNSIAYLNELYSLKQEELLLILSYFCNLYENLLSYKYKKSVENENFNNKQYDEIINKITENEMIDLIKRIQQGINYLKYNVNSRIVLDYIIMGGE